MQEVPGGQAGGDGFDLFGFADDQEHAYLEAPEGTVIILERHLSHANLLRDQGLRSVRARWLENVIGLLCAIHRMPQTAPQQTVGCQEHHDDKCARRYRQQPGVLPITVRTNPQPLRKIPDQDFKEHTGQN
ncbi:hypothetical protein D3C84_792570 [compost metagenome]